MIGEIRITMTEDEERNGTEISAQVRVTNSSLYDRLKLFDIMSQILELDESDIKTYIVAKACGIFNKGAEEEKKGQEIKFSDAFKKFMEDRQKEE